MAGRTTTNGTTQGEGLASTLGEGVGRLGEGAERLIGTVAGGVGVAIRSAALPVLLGARWLSRLPGARPDPLHAVPAVGPAGRARLLAKMAADEFFLAAELSSAAFLPFGQTSRVRREVDDALAFQRRRGFHRDPARYHAEPPTLHHVDTRPGRSLGLSYLEASFESGYAPHAGEPGRERWLSYAANVTAHARLLWHPGRPRPWVVCAPGFRMGLPAVDFAGFQAAWLHRELGLNVAIPVLPFHGPRRVGRRSGDGFLTGDVLDTVHAQAQAVWDLRRLIGWLRREGAPSVALYGLSLGGYTAALVASLAPRVDCVIAGIPASDWVRLLHGHAGGVAVRAAERLGVPWDDIEALLRVVSPLALAPGVPRERRFLFAGTGDRLAPPEQALALWRHWDEPRLDWYAGSHTSFLLEPAVKALVGDALQAGGLLGRPKRRAAPQPRSFASRSVAATPS